MHNKNLDQFVTIGIVIANVVWTLLLPYYKSGIGVIFAFPLVFGLPGYTLVQILTYKWPLGLSHSLVFSLGLSLAIDVLSGFILNLLPIGLQASSWVIFLGSLIVVFSLLTIYLRHNVQVPRAQFLRLRFTIRECVLFGLAGLVIVLSILYSARGVTQQPHPYFTQLWLLPSNQPHNSCAVQLGVRSFEATSTRYSIKVTVNGTQIKTESFVLLASGQQWEKVVPITPKVSDDMHVNASLYRSDKPKTAYRTVSLTLSVHSLKQGSCISTSKS